MKAGPKAAVDPTVLPFRPRGRNGESAPLPFGTLMNLVENAANRAEPVDRAGTAVLADMSQVAVARDVSPSVTVLNELYAKTDEVGLRVVTRYDVGLLHPEGVIVLSLGGS